MFGKLNNNNLNYIASYGRQSQQSCPEVFFTEHLWMTAFNVCFVWVSKCFQNICYAVENSKTAKSKTQWLKPRFSILQNTPGLRNTAKTEPNPLEDFSLLIQYELLKSINCSTHKSKHWKFSLFTNYFQSLFQIYLFKVHKTYNTGLFTIK